MVAASFGGLSSWATGGDFVQSAMIAATVHLLNDEGRRLYEDVKSQKLVDAHQELKNRLFLEASDNKGHVRLSKADILTLADYTVARVNAQNLSKLDAQHYNDFATFDTFLYNPALVSKQFYVEGLGVFAGGEINYIGVGIFAARYNYSPLTFATLNVGWNSAQILTFNGWNHNVRRIKFGGAWGNFDYDYYNNPESAGGK